MPVLIKQMTATQDLLLHLGIPHTPCPEVHPFPHFVPTPTNNPAIKYPIKLKPDTLSSALSNNYEFESPIFSLP